MTRRFLSLPSHKAEKGNLKCIIYMYVNIRGVLIAYLRVGLPDDFVRSCLPPSCRLHIW